MLLPEITEPLLRWYDAHKRDLPWRRTRDPYCIFVSEIMLQQTRVEAAKPYYERFIAALPDIRALAEADEGRLLKLWEGLGYYSRVRNLQKAAKLICRDHGGVFPSDIAGVLSLPGVGPYTAGAICSIAFGLPTPAVDGNVLRVISRLCRIDESIGDPRVKRRVHAALAEIYPPRRCGDFTQALMELGALVCLPGGMPLCDRCPLSGVCTVHAGGRETAYPVLPEKRPRTVERYTVFLLRCGDHIALRKRGDTGLLSGLFELPNTAGALTEAQARAWLRGEGLSVRSLKKRPRATHIFTHIEWRLIPYEAECDACTGTFLWATPAELEQTVSLPTAFKKLL